MCWFFIPLMLLLLPLTGCNFQLEKEFKVIKLWFALQQQQQKTNLTFLSLLFSPSNSELSTSFKFFVFLPFHPPQQGLIYGRKTKASMRARRQKSVSLRLCVTLESHGRFALCVQDDKNGLIHTGAKAKQREKSVRKTEKKTYPLET